MKRRSLPAALLSPALVTVVSALVLACAPASAQAADASMGTHGMALFGGQGGLYAAHLPMFHAPHDVQVVLRLHLADPRQDAALRARLDGKLALWTLDPERFELSRLDPRAAHPLKAFTANIVQGHFERGGQVRYRQARLVVDQVILYRPLNGAAAVRDAATYVPVGDFLVKLIDSRPDFDHILRLRRPATGPVVVPKAGLQANSGALARQVAVAGTIYLDGADLQ